MLQFFGHPRARSGVASRATRWLPLKSYVRRDRKELLQALFDLAGRSADISRIERSLASTDRLDFDLLLEVCDHLADLPLDGWGFRCSNGNEVAPRKNLADLREIVEAARDISAESLLMELLVRLEFGADGEMGVILETIPRNEVCGFKSWLIEKVEAKLGLFGAQRERQRSSRARAGRPKSRSVRR